MRIAINHETTAAARVSQVDMPLGAATKRELAMLTATLEAVRQYTEVHKQQLQNLHDRMDLLESKPLIVNRAVKGEKGDRGEQGPPGESSVVVVAPDYKDGAWYAFWRRWLLGVV